MTVQKVASSNPCVSQIATEKNGVDSAVNGTFFESGKDRAMEREGWAVPKIQCASNASRYSAPLTPQDTVRL